MTFELNPFEERVCKQILEKGYYKTKTGLLPKAKPKSNFVQAETIQRLFMAIPLAKGEPAHRLRHGFKLQGVWISGSLDLSGLNRGFDREAPPAAFVNCHFEGKLPKDGDPLTRDIDLSDAHFAKLSFKGSRFVDLVADNVIVNGPVDLSDVSSAECFVRKGTGCRRSPSETAFEYPLVPAGEAQEGDKAKRSRLPRCAANFAGARIQGDFTASRARLCVLPKVKGFDAAAGKRPYALKLSGSRISGSVVLQPEFSAHGGVALAHAHVGETIWMQGIRCSAEWDTKALDFGYAKCGGIISLTSCDRSGPDGSSKHDRVHSHGMINFYGTDLVGEVHMSGGCHTVPLSGGKPTGCALTFFQAKIGGLIRINADEHSDPDLGGLLMVENSSASGLTIDARICVAQTGANKAADHVTIQNCQIPGDVNLRFAPAHSLDAAKLAGACRSNQVMGNVSFHGAGLFEKLDLSGVVCNGAVQITGVEYRRDYKHRPAGDQVSPPAPPSSQSGPALLTLKNGRVDGMLLVDQCAAETIELRNCRVGGNAKLQGLRVRTKLDASNMRIDGELQVAGVVADAMQHGGDPAGSDDRKAESGRQLPHFDFMGTRVGAALKFNALDYQWSECEPEVAAQETAFKAIKTQNLTFYPGHVLVEAVMKNGAHTAYLWDEKTRPIHLNGTSPPIHAFNAELGDKLKIDQTTAVDYLRFFCSMVWGDAGWFRIPFDEDGLLRYSGEHIYRAKPLAAKGATIIITPDPADETAFFAKDVPIIYAWHVFMAEFRITSTGMVEMLDDDPLFALQGECPITFSNGYRRYNPRTPWEQLRSLSRRVVRKKGDPFDILPGDWTPLDDSKVREFSDRIRKQTSNGEDLTRADQQQPEGLPRVNLAFVECSYLNDAAGQAWRKPPRQWSKRGRQLFQLDLDNFRYALHNEVPEASQVKDKFGRASAGSSGRYNQWEARRDWLKLQYLGDKPKDADEFNVQPYEYLAHLLRRAGRTPDAAKIVHDRMVIESGFNWENWRKNFSESSFGAARFTLLLIISGVVGFLTYYILGSGNRALLAAVLGAVLIYCYPWWADKLYRYFFYYGLSPVWPTATFVGCILIGSLVTQYWQHNNILIFDEMPVELRSDKNSLIYRSVGGGSGIPERLAVVKSCGDQINVPLYAIDTFVPLIDLKQEIRCRPNPDRYGHWQMAKSIYTALGWIVTSMLILAVTGLIRRRSEG